MSTATTTAASSATEKLPPRDAAAASATVVATFFFSGFRSRTSLIHFLVSAVMLGLGSVVRCESRPSLAAQTMGFLQSPHRVSGGVANFSTS